MHGREITYLERQKIEYRLACKVSIREIAKVLRRNHSVVCREICRNKKPDGSYSAVYAESLCEKRRVRCGNVKRKLDKYELHRDFVVGELKRGRTPDVIAGRMKILPPQNLQGVTISQESIYTWLYEGEGHTYGYWQYLPTRRRKRRKRGTRRKQRKICIPERVSIHVRDEAIHERKELGHWETDSVIYGRSGSQRLSVQTERKARFVQIHRLPSGSAKDTLDALRETVTSVPQDLVKTITFDNGSEGALHSTLVNDYNIETYFCDPYSSWQKGGVENMNKLIRRYLPKGTDLSMIHNQTIYDIQERLNNTPRKILNYRTPKEVLFSLSPEVVH
jgi:IS30 family transposase